MMCTAPHSFAFTKNVLMLLHYFIKKIIAIASTLLEVSILKTAMQKETFKNINIFRYSNVYPKRRQVSRSTTSAIENQ